MRLAWLGALLLYGNGQAISFGETLKALPGLSNLPIEDCKAYEAYTNSFFGSQCYRFSGFNPETVMSASMLSALQNRFYFSAATRREGAYLLPDIQAVFFYNQVDKKVVGVAYMTGGLLENKEMIVVVDEDLSND